MNISTCSVGLASLNGEVYAIGGRHTVQKPAYATVDIYDPAINVWSPSCSMQQARHSLGEFTRE